MTQPLPLDGGLLLVDGETTNFDKVIKVCVEKTLENCKDEDSLAKSQFIKFEGKIKLTRDGRLGAEGNWLDHLLTLLEKADQDLERHITIFRKITGVMTFGWKRILEGLESLLWSSRNSENMFVLKEMLLAKGVNEADIPSGLEEDKLDKLALLILFNNVVLNCFSKLEATKAIPVVEDPKVKTLRDELKRKDADMALLQKQFKELQESLSELKIGLSKKGKRDYQSDQSENDDSGDSDASMNSTYKEARRKALPVVVGNTACGSNPDIEEYMVRKVSQREMYDKDRRPITMEQMIRMICDTGKGLIIYDILGNEHMVSMKKGSSTRVLSCRVKRGKGPDGVNKASLSILHDAPKIFPQSNKHFDGFIREQMTLASNARKAPRNRDIISQIDDKVDILNTFKDKFVRRIQLVMGEVGSEKTQHVSLWAVLLHFLIVIWNTAITSDRFAYLISTEVDSRWEREFSD